MMPPRRGSALAVGTGSVTTIVLTAVLVGRSLGRGVLLYRDFVTAPVPVLTSRTLGLDGPAPRAVPLDAVTALLAPVVPPGVQQQVMLVASVLLAGLGVTALLRRHGPVATTVGAAVATWSPYAVERLLLGQPPTLLAVAVVPWIVLVAREARSRRAWLLGTLLVALPAALTPIGGVLAGGAALVAARTWRRADSGDLLRVAALALVWCAPWLVVASTGRTDAGRSAGAAAFAVRAGGVSGLVDVLGGGGIWSLAATPVSRTALPALAASVVVLVLAVVGVRALQRARGLASCLLVGPPVVALLLATPPGVAVFAAAQSVPGLALFRDTHRWSGLGLVTASVLAGLGSASLARTASRRVPPAASRPARHAPGVPTAISVTTAVLGVSVALLSVPDAASRLGDAYRPRSFPASWSAAVAAVGDRPALVLPFQPLRTAAWAGPHPFLDPTGLALTAPVTQARDLVVVRDGRTLLVGSADPPAADRWRTGDLDADQLRALGIEVVVEWHATPGRGVPADAGRRGLVEQLRTPELSVWRVGR